MSSDRCEDTLADVQETFDKGNNEREREDYDDEIDKFYFYDKQGARCLRNYYIDRDGVVHLRPRKEKP